MISRLLSLIALNVMYVVFCIPLVTIPGASVAMMKCVGRMLDDEDFSLFGTFFTALKSEFFKTLAAGWLMLLLFVGALFGALFYWSADAQIMLIPAVFCVIFAVLLFSAYNNLICMLANVRLPFGALMKNAFLLLFTRPLHGIAASCVALLILAVCTWWFPRSIPVLILIAFSVGALVACFGVRDAVEKHIIKR
jgi:uncharacterized membrane protein YesL